MAKGSQYERDICYKLSEWWTGKKGASIFWRTSMSGGRGTVRAKKGLETSGHYGDICATHPSGNSLMKVVTIEVKRGYNKDSLFNLLDKQENRNPSGFEQWLLQADKAAMLADSDHWMIIARRTQKLAMIFFPIKLWQDLFRLAKQPLIPNRYIEMRANVKYGKKHKPYHFVGMTLDEFLERIPAKAFKQLSTKL